MDVLLTVGEFSRMTHLSVKALHHYHEIGLLEPVDVDPANGYRRYASMQVPTAQLIRRFRDLDMPLDEVRAVLDAPDTESRDAAILRHLARMEQRLEETQATVASLRKFLEQATPRLRVDYRSVAAIPAVAIREVVGFDNAESWLGAACSEIAAALDATGTERRGPDGALYSEEFFEAGAGEVVAFVPIDDGASPVDPAHRSRVELLELPAVELAVTVHRGSFADLDQAYAALGTFVAERGLGVPGPIRELYVVSGDDTDEPGEWRTDVCWPISHRPVELPEADDQGGLA